MNQILERRYLAGLRIIIKLTAIQPVIFYTRYSSLYRHISYTRDELQKSLNNLGESMADLYDKKASLEEFVYKFRSTNDKYNRIKNAVKEHVNRFWSQALREPDKKMLTSIVLSSVIEALREK